VYLWCWYGIIKKIVQWEYCHRETWVQLYKINNKTLLFQIFYFKFSSRILGKVFEHRVTSDLVVAKQNRGVVSRTPGSRPPYPRRGISISSFYPNNDNTTKTWSVLSIINYLATLVPMTTWYLNSLLPELCFGSLSRCAVCNLYCGCRGDGGLKVCFKNLKSSFVNSE
jgi:hypothetical protein